MKQHEHVSITGRIIVSTLFAGILLAAGFSPRSMAATTARDISVLDYGAVPDDNKDDTAAVKGALAACAAKGPKTVYFSQGVFTLSDVTFPNDVAVVVENGARLEIASNATVALDGPFSAGPYTVFSGAGRVTFGSCNDIRVDWFGARNDGSADATEGINKAIAALPTFANLTFGGGNYLVIAGNLTPITTKNVVQISGQGIDTTRITFNPTNESTLFTFKPIDVPSALVWRCGIRDMSIYGGGAAKKTAIRVVEGTSMTIEDIHINYVHATDTESIGLLLQNRDVSSVRNVSIYAPRPIFIANNPYPNQQTGLDHWCFTDMGLYGTKPEHPLIEVEDGCNLSNVIFDGRQVWVGGNGGFYWDSSTKSTGNGINIAFNNIRWESGGVTQTRPTFYLKPHTHAGPVLFNNIYCGTATTGFYLRNVKSATFIAVNVGGAKPGCHAYDIDASCDDILFSNFSADQNAGTPVVTGLTKIFSSGFTDYQPPETERIKFYVNDSVKSEYNKYFSIMDHRVWTKAAEIDDKTGDGLGYAIPGAVSDGITQILVAFDEGAGTNSVAGGGHFLVTKNSADGTSVKLSGTDNTVAGRDKQGAVCVYAARGTNTIRIQNKLGSKRRFSLIVYYNSPTFPL